MSLPQAPHSCQVGFFLSILTKSCSLGTRFSGGWNHQKQKIKSQICSAVLAAASGNMLGCLAGLAEALEAAEPEPNAGLRVRCARAPCRHASCPGKAGAEPALCGEGLQSAGSGFGHPPVWLGVRSGQGVLVPPRRHGGTARSGSAQAAPRPHGQDGQTSPRWHTLLPGLEQKLQALKCMRRDLRSRAISIWHEFPAAHHPGTEAGEIYGRSGLGGNTRVIPNSTALILRRQRGLRQRGGLGDKQIILSCLRGVPTPDSLSPRLRLNYPPGRGFFAVEDSRSCKADGVSPTSPFWGDAPRPAARERTEDNA